MENCPSKQPVNEIADAMSTSNNNINVENLSFHSSDPSQLSSRSISGTTPIDHDAVLNTTNVVNNYLQSVDDNMMLYSSTVWVVLSRVTCLCSAWSWLMKQ
jgi:hypothetical protein